MKKILLNSKLKRVSLVDDKDFELVNKYKWHLRAGYAISTVRGNKCSHCGNNKRVHLSLHRLILNAKKGDIVDHIDGNPLNNQKSNLRFCTASQNRMNSRKAISKKKQSTSPYKGVHQKFGRKGWTAQIFWQGKEMYLGDFKTPELASEAYRNKAKELFGVYAKLII